MSRVLPPSRLSWNVTVAPSPKASLWSHSSPHPVLTVVLQEPSLTKMYTLAPSQVSNPSSLLSALNKLQKENVTHHCFSDDLLQVCSHSLLFCPFVPRVSPITYFSPSMGISAFILQLLQSTILTCILSICNHSQRESLEASSTSRRSLPLWGPSVNKITTLAAFDHLCLTPFPPPIRTSAPSEPVSKRKMVPPRPHTRHWFLDQLI